MLSLVDLKRRIEKKEPIREALVLQYVDNPFICFQYIKQICRDAGLHEVFINDLQEEDQSFLRDPQIFYVLNTDKLNRAPELSQYSNTALICKEIDKDSKVEFYRVSPLEDWQKKDYLRAHLMGLTEEEQNQLYGITQGDIYALEKECQRFSAFPEKEQSRAFESFMQEGGYGEGTSYNIFDFVRAFSTKDLPLLASFMPYLDSMDVDILDMPPLIHKQLLGIIEIQLNPKATPESLKMSYGQFKAIQHSCGHYTPTQLQKMLKFISSLDYELKSGHLDMDDCEKRDYTICKLLQEGL